MRNFLSASTHRNKEEFIKEFDRIAEIILNRTELLTIKDTFLIREIEFYYYSQAHTDIYCHKHERQGRNARFYFHRYTNPKSYAEEEGVITGNPTAFWTMLPVS